MLDLLLAAYLLYALGAGAWIGDHTPELLDGLLGAWTRLSRAIHGVKRVIRAAS